VGESVAQQVTFLFFANLMANYELSNPKGETLPSICDYRDGAAIGPQKFSIQLKSL